MNKRKYLAILPLGVGFLGMLHQYLTGGGWFNWSQVLDLHHEHLILLSFIVAILLWGRRP